MQAADISPTDNQFQMIHIVDPDSTVRRSLLSLLLAHGFSVKTWDAGEAFLSEADLASSGVLILSHGYLSDAMPVVHALQARNSPIKIIILSAHGKSVSPLDEALRLGVLAWLDKPCPNDELAQWVTRALSEVGRCTC